MTTETNHLIRKIRKIVLDSEHLKMTFVIRGLKLINAEPYNGGWCDSIDLTQNAHQTREVRIAIATIDNGTILGHRINVCAERLAWRADRAGRNAYLEEEKKKENPFT